jgi:hypothetical protein
MPAVWQFCIFSRKIKDHIALPQFLVFILTLMNEQHDTCEEILKMLFIVVILRKEKRTKLFSNNSPSVDFYSFWTLSPANIIIRCDLYLT